MSKERNICNVKGCINEGRYCRIHLNYSVPVKTVIPVKSDKQKDLDKKFAKAKREYLKEHPFCETKGKIEGCTKVSIDVHHMAGKATEELLLDKSLFLGVCRHCHTVIEKNPAFARQNGFSVSRLTKRA
jgi:hypothetical protein